MISDKISDRINSGLLCSLNFRALKERSWQHGQCLMIKNVITTLAEERQMHIRKVLINLEFLGILLVTIEPSCTFVDKDLGLLKEEENIFVIHGKTEKLKTYFFFLHEKA